MLNAVAACGLSGLRLHTAGDWSIIDWAGPAKGTRVNDCHPHLRTGTIPAAGSGEGIRERLRDVAGLSLQLERNGSHQCKPEYLNDRDTARHCHLRKCMPP
jgi:hypothetical protein